jgi:hypothetical protein
MPHHPKDHIAGLEKISRETTPTSLSAQMVQSVRIRHPYRRCEAV